MIRRRPRWAWLLFPQLSFIICASVLAANHRLPRIALDGGLDKVGHFLLLGALSFLAVGFFFRTRWPWVVAALGALSALEEASQAWFPARTVDAGDLAANLLGIALGGAFAAYLARRRSSYPAGAPSRTPRHNFPPSPITRADDQPDTDRPAVRAPD